MFLFLKLYFAHLLGDFVLQFEELYQLKIRSQLGHFFHVMIHALLMIVVTLPYLDMSFMWFFICGVVAVHYMQDNLKYRLQLKFPQHRFFLFVADQLLHGLVVATILLFPASREVRTFDGQPWDLFYAHSFWALLAIAFVLTTFAGSYLLHAFRSNFFPGRPDHFITNFEMSHAIVERTTITGLFLFTVHPALLGATLLISILRLPSKKLRSMPDFIMSFIYAAFVGLLFRIWL